MSETADIPQELVLQGRAWPFEEARKLIARYGGSPRAAGGGKAPEKGFVLFETGYGPSGLPHIGTFGEVVRTAMVRYAFERMTGIKTRLFAFSDDMDGLRKVPDNVPSKDMMARYIGDKVRTFGTPLTSIPDPFSNEYPSFGHHNNARLRAFLDAFGFDYEFQSATDWYTSGRLDEVLLEVLAHYEAVRDVVLPTLGPDRRKTYCPFLPIRERDGRKQVLEVLAVEIRPESGTVVFEDAVEGRFEQKVTGGACKLQWKVDWAARWVALDVDYEMSGKDLIDSVKLSSRIARILGARPPEGFNYELFLDEKGEKISKSKGNGLTVEEWLEHGPQESLSLYMVQSPKSAKQLHFDVIPRQIDDYLGFLKRFPQQPAKEKLDNPVWHIHSGSPPPAEDGLPFNILLNLVGVANTEDRAVLWGFIARYRPGATPATHPFLDQLVGHAIAYWRRFVKPSRRFRPPSERERAALADLVAALAQFRDAPLDSERIQFEVYEVGKRHGWASDLRAWFRTLYEILFGTQDGPRMGSFIAIYGVPETIALIERVLAGEDLGRAA